MSISQVTSVGASPITGPSPKPVARWATVLLPCVLFLGAATTSAFLGGPAALFPSLLLVSAAAFITMTAALDTQSNGPGPADVITGIRLGMAIGIGSAVLFADPDAALLTAVLVAALATDAFDGWLARGSGTTSDFGARFDLETDAVLLAAAALSAMPFAGPAVLIAPLLRPAWILGGRYLTWLEQPLPPSLRRQTLCAVPIFLLLFVPWPLGDTGLAKPTAMVATLLMVASFMIDFAYQWQHRPNARSTA